MKKGIKYLAVFFSVVFLLTILIPAQSLHSQEQADEIQLISVTPPKGTILQRGTEVPFEVKVNYKLESQPSGFVYAGLKLLSGRGVGICQAVDVSQGSGTVVISGLVYVEDLYNWVETDTVYLELVLGYWYSDSKDEGEVLDLKCLTEYPYYIKGEAPPENQPPAADEGEDQPVIEEEAPPEKQPPVALFNYSPESPGINREIRFNASSSSDPDGENASYEWDFGDGLTGVGQETTHSYNKADTYLVTLLVTDNKGATNTKVLPIPISLYPSDKISTPPSGPPTLEFANLDPEGRIELYKVIKQVLNVEQAKIEHQGRYEDTLFSYMNNLLKQLDDKQKDKDLQEIDIVRENALSEGLELVLDIGGGLAGAGITSLTGIPAPFLGEGAKLLGFYIGEKLVLGDIGTVTVKYPKIGRMEIVSTPSKNKILVNAYFEEPINQNIFIIIPVEFKPLRTLWGTYIFSPMWCGITCPPEAAIKETVPKLEDIQIKIVDLHSPGELRVYDSNERITGLINGEEKEQITDSEYVDGTLVIFFPSGSYRYEVIGTYEGLYALSITSIQNSEETIFTAIDIPTDSGQNHQYIIDWGSLSQDEKGATLQIDSDGDGTFEKTFTADSELTHDEFVSETAGLSFWIWIAVGAGITLILVISFILIKRRLARK